MSEPDRPRPQAYLRLLREPGTQLICLISMVSMMSSSIVSPALPIIQRDFGVSPAAIGLVMTAFSLSGLLFSPAAGVLADRYGRRAVIVPMMMLYGVAGSLTAFAPDFETLLALRFIAGIGASAVSFLSITLVGDLFERHQRAAVLGYRIAAGQSANIALPMLAGALALLGWQYPFVIFVLTIPVGVFTLFVLEPGERRTSQTLGRYVVDLGRALSDLRIAGLLSVAPTLMIVGQGAVATYIPIYMASELGASALVIGVFLSARVVAGIAVSLSMGRLDARFGGERLILAAIAMFAVGLVWVPFTGSVWELLGPGMLFGIGSGIGYPAFQSLLVNEAPEHMLAAVTAANGMTNRFGQTVGPLLGGGLFTLGGLDAVFFGAVAFLAVMGAFYLAIFRRRLAAASP